MNYSFEEVLEENELQLLRENGIPLKCKRNETAVREVVRRMIQELPTMEDAERIADKLLDNIVPSDFPVRSKEFDEDIIRLLEKRFEEYCKRYGLDYNSYDDCLRMFQANRENHTLDRLQILKKTDYEEGHAMGKLPAKIDFEITFFSVTRNLS